MIQNGKGMLVLVNHLLTKLKEEGIYDNCAIVIMADHGGRFSGVKEKEELDRANPLLLVKGFGEKHPLKVSANPISYDYLQDAFVSLINGSKGEDIFAESSSEEKRRFFISTANFQEYYTQKHAFDPEALQPTGNVYEKIKQ